MTFHPGSRLGVYEIVSPLGAGGMGEVFRARDTRLKRDVAIKVLPASVTHDRERLGRFRREAELLAALNHPNIAAVHGFEESGDTHAIVMELADGGTLADRLTAQGPLPISEALAIAREVADALEAAHDKGIIHRDLKPGNIGFTADGKVKVLDFGLAKALDSAQSSGTASASASLSPTLTSPAMTELGLILGTAAYMSPEQAKGRPADKRSDIWAFGCVLFEMLTGKRAFAGEDVSDTLAAVLRGEPDWSALPVALPLPIRTLIERCLQKDRRKRIGDISTAIFLIDEPALGQLPAGPVVAPTRRAGARLAWLAATALLALGAGAVYMLMSRPAAPREVLRFQITAPAESSIAVGVIASTAVSPDGRHVVFVMGAGAGQGNKLAVRSLHTLEARALPGTDDGSNPFWSPDSRFVAFFARGRLKKVDLSGSPAQDLCAAMAGSGGTWNSDGTIVFAPSATGGLFKVPQAGGTPVQVTALDTTKNERSHRWPWFLPDGKHFLFVAQGPATIHLGSLDSPNRTELVKAAPTNGISRALYSEGHLLYVQDGTLIAQPFDATALGMTGEPFPIAREIMFNPSTAAASLAVSANGVLSYRSGVTSEVSQLVWLDRAGKRIGTVGEPADQLNLALSHDGERVAVSLLDPARNTRDLAIYDLTRGGLRTRFTFDPADEYAMSWMPDGSEIIFNSSRKADQQLDLYQKASSGAGGERLLFDDPANNVYVTDISADGRFLLYNNGNANSPTGNDIFALRLGGQTPTSTPILQTTFNETAGRVSPNGKWLAYQSNESGSGFEIFVAPFPAEHNAASPAASTTGTGKWQISRLGGTTPRWRSDGRELFYLSTDTQLMAVEVRGDGSAFEFGQPRPLFKLQARSVSWLGYGIGNNYDVAPGGQRFIVNSVSQAAVPPPITIVVNWTAGIQK